MKISKFEFGTSAAIEAKDAITDKMKAIVKRARDEGRDLTKEEDAQIQNWEDIRDGWKEIEHKSSYLDEVAANSDADFSVLQPGDLTSYRIGGKSASVRNLWGDMIVGHHMRENRQEAYEARSITTTTAGAIVQDPTVINDYYGNLQHTNALGKLGVQFITSDTNYMQYPYASGEALVRAHGTEGAALTADSAFSLQSRKLGWFTRYIVFDVSFELQEDAPYSTEILGMEANTAINNDILTNFMQGDGSTTPTGLDSLSGLTATDFNGSAFDWSDVADWYGVVMANRAEPENLGMLYGTSTWKTLTKLQESGPGQYINPPRALERFKMEWTSAVKETYGGGSDQTKVYLGDFSTCRVIFSRAPMRMIYSRSQLGTNLNHRYVMVTRYDNMFHYPALLHRVDELPT